MSLQQAIDTLLDADRESLIDIEDKVEELITSLTKKIQPLPVTEIEGCDQVINELITNVIDSCDEGYVLLHWDEINIKRIVTLKDGDNKFDLMLNFSYSGSDLDNEYDFQFYVKLFNIIYCEVYYGYLSSDEERREKMVDNSIEKLNDLFFDGKETDAKIRECIIQMTSGMHDYDGEIAKAIEGCKTDFLRNNS